MKTKVLIYCTKGTIWKLEKVDCGYYDLLNDNSNNCLNGKIVAECEVECEEMYTDENGMSYYTDTIKEDYMVSKLACLDDSDIYNYLGNNVGYALHISNLKVFDEPLELSEVSVYNKDRNNSFGWLFDEYIPLKKAPQNMMWVWYKGERYCLISTRPECVCKIANGEKDIEVRKKVLKGMI